MLGLAILLTVIVADAADVCPSPRGSRGRELLHLTTNEIRHLLNVLIIRPAQRLIHYLHWSGWRRAHGRGELPELHGSEVQLDLARPEA